MAPAACVLSWAEGALLVAGVLAASGVVDLIDGGIRPIVRGGTGAPRAGERSGAEGVAEVLAGRCARGGINTDRYRERRSRLYGSGL